MKTNFKKITAVAASFLVAGLTLGTASAAQYPAPFKDNGSVDAAIVYGSDAASTDQTAASNIQEDLDLPSTVQTSAGEESVRLDRDSSRLYVNASLDQEESNLDSDNLPEVLSEGTFGGAEAGSSSNDVDYDQEVTLGSSTVLNYKNHPDSSEDDPVLAWETSDDVDGGQIMNMTIDFDNSVAFNDSDSTGEELEMFGETYSVSGDTTDGELYLSESSDDVSLGIGAGSNKPNSMDVTVDGESYTIELDSVDSGNNDATVTVTDSEGNSETESIAEDTTEDINGITVTLSDSIYQDLEGSSKAETTLSVSGSSGQLLLQDGSEVQEGVDEDSIDGTHVSVNSAAGSSQAFGAADSITISVAHDDNDENGILPGESYTDHVFDSMSVVFEDLNVPMDSDDRETLEVNPSDESASLSFTSHEGNEESFQFYYNESDAPNNELSLANNGDRINVREGANLSEDEYIVLNDEDSSSGSILQFDGMSDDSDDYNDDEVSFTNILTGESIDADIVSNGTAEVDLDSGTYGLEYDTSGNEKWVVFNHFASNDNPNDAVMFPTVETSLGAKLAFYEPQTINLSDYDGLGNDLDGQDLRFPDGDTYTDVDVSNVSASEWSFNGDNVDITSAGNNETVNVGQLSYSINSTGNNDTVEIQLYGVDGTPVSNPSFVLFEEEDESSNYNALIARLSGGTSDNEATVDDIERTWSSDDPNWEHSYNSDNDMTGEFDYYGTEITLDSSDSDMTSAEISYPDEQVYANTFLSGSASSETDSGNVMYTDSETSSYEDKNVIVVGGSAVNEAAAQLMGVEYPTGGSDFTDAAGISQGEYLVKGYTSPWNEDKVALLVAGYSASDTQDAANWVTSNDFDSSNVDQMGPTSGQ